MVSVEASPGRHQGNTGAVRGEDKEDTRTKTGHPEVQHRVPIGAGNQDRPIDRSTNGHEEP